MCSSPAGGMSSFCDTEEDGLSWTRGESGTRGVVASDMVVSCSICVTSILLYRGRMSDNQVHTATWLVHNFYDFKISFETDNEIFTHKKERLHVATNFITRHSSPADSLFGYMYAQLTVQATHVNIHVTRNDHSI